MVAALRTRGIDVTTDPNEDYDLLHLQWIGPKSLRYAQRARKKNRPVVLIVHSFPRQIAGALNGSPILTPVYRRYLKTFLHNVDLMIAPSPKAAQYLAMLNGTRPIRVISSGVDLHRFCFSQEKRYTFRRTYGLDRPTVLAAGQVTPLKGVKTFLQVAQILPDLLFRWVGPRPSRLFFFSPRFELTLHNRPENVRFDGYLTDIDFAYCGEDIFFYPSHGESLGLVILEAAAVGLPLVVRDLPIYRGWLEKGPAVQKENTPAEFATAIENLFVKDIHSDRLSELVREHSLQQIGKRTDECVPGAAMTSRELKVI
jgi:1,2-diacylglycerol-3-alpha-glucose alpha-1,2-glucosyltransferase